MKSFQKFTEDNNKGILFIEKEDGSVSEWLFTIDISDIWENLNNKIILENDFSSKLCNIFLNNKDNIIEKVGDIAFDEINKIILELGNTNDQKILNKLYDICDEYEINLKTTKNSNVNEAQSSDIYAYNDKIVIDYKGKEHTANIKKVNSESSFSVEITDDLSLRGLIFTIDISNIISLTQKGSTVTGDSRIKKGKTEPYSNDMVL